MNFQHFTNPTSPEFVILHDEILYNHPSFWDDNLSKIALLYNYSLIDTATVVNEIPIKLLLFKKNSHAKKINFIKIKTDSTELGKYYRVPHSDEPLLMKAVINNSTFENFQKLVYQPSSLKIDIEKGNEKSEYNCLIPIFKSGVLINRVMNSNSPKFSFNNQEIVKYYTHNGK